MEDIQKSASLWIWTHKDAEGVNQYSEFRHEFNLDVDYVQNEDYKLYISVDSDYVVWINGQFVACGQYSDYPNDKVYDVLNVESFIRPGKNVLCVLVYYQGESTSTYLKGEPGLWYTLQGENFNIKSDEEVYCRKSLTYKKGPISKITGQLSFTYEYDAQGEDHWRSLDYNIKDSGWQLACKRERLLGENPIFFSKRPILHPRDKVYEEEINDLFTTKK